MAAEWLEIHLPWLETIGCDIRRAIPPFRF